MLEEAELMEKLREIVWEADLFCIIRKKLEEHFGIDLSSKKQKKLINLQIICFLEEQLKTEALNEEVRGEGEKNDKKEETSEKVKEEDYGKMDGLKKEETGIGNDMKSCFQNLKASSKGKETERQFKEEEEDATSKSKKPVEKSNGAREDEAPMKLKKRKKETNDRVQEAPIQSKETVEKLVSAGEEEIPSKSKKSKRARQDETSSKEKEGENQPKVREEEDMQKSEKPRKKSKRTKVEEAPIQSKETVEKLVSAGEEEIPSKSKKSKRARQDETSSKEKEGENQPKVREEEDMQKSGKPRKKSRKRKIKGVVPKTEETEKQRKEGEEEALPETKEVESQPQKDTKAKSPPNDKDQKRAGSAFLDPLPISDALVKFLGADETALSRTEAAKKIWIHIKQKKLQDCYDKQKVICDNKLKELFQVESFSGYNVLKLLEPHFPKMEKSEALE